MLEEQLRRYILTQLAVSQPVRLGIDEPLFESILDSTSVLALVSFLEQKYGIAIRDSEVIPANFSSLRLLSTFVERKVAQAAEPRTTPPLAANG